MPEIATLEVKVGPVAPNQVELLVKNIGATLVEQLMIEFKFDLGLVTKQVADAVEQARQQNVNSQTTASKVSLANVVTGPAGWSVWAMAERTESLAVIRLLNDVDQNGNKLATPVKLDQNAQFTVRVPVTPPAKPTHVELPYSYRYPNVGRGGKQTDGKLELTIGDSGSSSKVLFSVNHPSPTTITAGDKVYINWKIENGVSATLYGPLPGANTQMSLSSDPLATYKISEGSIQIVAVGAATYILHAEVRGSRTNELVIKTVQIDVTSAKQYSFIEVRPSIVLPRSMVEINWAVWDCKEAWVWAGKDHIQLQLTEQGPSERYQGSGIWRVNARKEEGIVDAWLELLQDGGQNYRTVNALFKVVGWEQDATFNGNALGMAVTAPKLALITADKLWLADVAYVDTSPPADFKEVKLDAPPKAWRAIAAFDKGFVALQQTKADELVVARYDVNGKPDGLPVSLGDGFKTMLRRSNTICELAALGDRVYVVIEGAAAPGGSVRHAMSVTFKPQARLDNEPSLEPFPHYRMFAFDKALYLINRSNGQMFRFRQDRDGELDQPAKAASAVKDGQSMIRKGLIVAVGRVLLVLGPSSCPDVEEVEGDTGMKYSSAKNLLASGPVQDLVYNPQQDHWIPCGHGLDIERTSVVAYRPGSSKRLWVVNPDHKVHTVGVHEHLFAPEFEEDFSPKTLPPYVIETNPRKARKVNLQNQSKRNWVSMTDWYPDAGLATFSASGPAEIVRIPETIGNGSSTRLEFHINEADPVPITMRYLCQPTDGAAHEYMVEINFSGPGLTKITSVFKRLTRDPLGNISIIEVPGTRADHDPNDVKVQPPPKALVDGLTLTIRNRTSYSLVEKRTKARERPDRYLSSFPMRIDWTSPEFVVYAHGVGQVRFDIDLLQPHGLELLPSTQPQTKCVRIATDGAPGLVISSASFKEPNEYECEIYYRIEKELPAVVAVAGGQGSEDGRAFYLCASPSVAATQAYVARIDPNSLEINGTSGATPAQNLFSAPRGIGALKDYVVAMFGDNNIQAMDHSLKPIKVFPVSDYTALPYMGSYSKENKIFFLAMKQEGSGQTAKYKYDYKETLLYKTPPNSIDTLASAWSEELDALQGFVTTNRVPGAPRWVSPTTVSPVAMFLHGVKFAICVEGGAMLCEPRPRTKWTDIRIEGAGREEAMIFDNGAPVLYTAHSNLKGDGLVITRTNIDNVNDKKSVTLPGAVVDMATDTRPFTTPALRYRHYRAVSLVAPGSQDALFVTHGTTIYQLNSADLTITRTATVDLPCRFIAVGVAKPPGSSYGTFSAPLECWMMWVVGATYKGDGSSVDQYKTKLYKIGFQYYEP